MNKVNLHGLRLLNTRPLLQADALNQRITAVNGLALSCPTLEITPTPSQWVRTLPSLSQLDYAIFTSANAVHNCLNTLKGHLISWPKTIQNIAIGKATAAALNKYHLQVNLMPDIADSEHLLTISALQSVTNKHILLIKGIGGRTIISDQLTKRGAHLIELPVYQRNLPEIDNQQLNRWWREDAVDIILITSLEAMQNLFLLFDTKAHPWLKKKTWLVISERLMNAASTLGIKHVKLCNIETIIETLEQLIK